MYPTVDVQWRGNDFFIGWAEWQTWPEDIRQAVWTGAADTVCLRPAAQFQRYDTLLVPALVGLVTLTF